MNIAAWLKESRSIFVRFCQAFDKKDITLRKKRWLADCIAAFLTDVCAGRLVFVIERFEDG